MILTKLKPRQHSFRASFEVVVKANYAAQVVVYSCKLIKLCMVLRIFLGLLG